MTLAPQSPRYISLDLCRGVAVLGILLVNAIAFAQPLEVYQNPSLSVVPLSQADRVAWWMVSTFATEKFYTILAMLSGIGLALSAAPEDQRRSDGSGSGSFFKKALFRRQAWLIIIGLLHGFLVWEGDILVLYGVCGFMLWNWRHAPGKQLLLFGLLFFLLGSAIVLWLEWQTSPVDVGYNTKTAVRTIFNVRSSFAGSLSANAEGFSQIILNEIITFAPKTLGLMMLGLGLFKTGFLKGHASVSAHAAFTALGAVSLGMIGWQNLENLQGGFAYPDFYTKGQVDNEFLSLLVSLGYMSGLMLIVRTGGLRKLLHPLIACGRMSLSAYLLQSLIMTALCYGGRLPALAGLPLFGRLNQADLMPFVLCIWGFELAFCTIWLRFCHYGPFEWLWRSLSRGQPVTLFKRLDIQV